MVLTGILWEFMKIRHTFIDDWHDHFLRNGHICIEFVEEQHLLGDFSPNSARVCMGNNQRFGAFMRPIS